ncbi:DUF5719 family protein [Nocardioides solisilvae]|uniref:DUF5719 family protein n=1 Tax=Nocardioides solisilvae TaxID=1542435 RepID=UPI0013A54070|nr:DUF5719 family protein [Nocardioides solisilvae]
MSEPTSPTPAPGSTPPGARAGGSRRRVAEPRERSISSTTLLAVVVPVLTVGALALVHPTSTEDAGRAPTPAALSRATVVCPPADGRAGEVAALVAGAGSGGVAPGDSGTLRVKGADDDVAFAGHRVTTLRARGQVVLRAEGDAAPGLVAARTAGGASVECVAPAAEQWFTGVGAGAERGSRLTLVNPDGGPAVADVTVLGDDGPVEVPALRGLTVRGGQATRVDLAAVVPRRDALTLHVRVTRGRLGVSVLDRFEELGGGTSTTDWLPARSGPATTDYLLGLGGGTGSRELVLANPGDDEARVRVRLVTPRSELSPAGLEEVVVPPGSTTVTDLGDVLGDPVARGAVGVRLDGDVPVTASLRSVTGEDLSFAVGAEPLVERAVSPLPPGPKRLVLAGAERVTAVRVVLRDAAGREVAAERVALQPGTAARTSLPGEARSVELLLDGVPVRAALESGPPGLAVRPLHELTVRREVPVVRPGLY